MAPFSVEIFILYLLVTEIAVETYTFAFNFSFTTYFGRKQTQRVLLTDFGSCCFLKNVTRSVVFGVSVVIV